MVGLEPSGGRIQLRATFLHWAEGFNNQMNINNFSYGMFPVKMLVWLVAMVQRIRLRSQSIKVIQRRTIHLIIFIINL